MSSLFLVLMLLWFLFDTILFLVNRGIIKNKSIESLLAYFKINNIPFNTISTIITVILVITLMVSVAIK
ncbi:hypothetical protein DOZ58_10325 [Acetobacterium sp. KB-1]|nr:hypothetical protein DOZ58_10325 [Acetobacterium sp. KB-1]